MDVNSATQLRPVLQAGKRVPTGSMIPDTLVCIGEKVSAIMEGAGGPTPGERSTQPLPSWIAFTTSRSTETTR
jgi:hypothetical protein